MSLSTTQLTQSIASIVDTFLNEYDGYQFSVSEEHRKPSHWDGGKQTLTITIVCPTGELPIKEEVES